VPVDLAGPLRDVRLEARRLPELLEHEVESRENIVNVKVWQPDGTLTWTLLEPERIGTQYPLGGNLLGAIETGEADGHLEDLRVVPVDVVKRYFGQFVPAKISVTTLGGKAGVFFDTSVWSPLDLLGLYRLVGPEQVVYASDYPYGQQPASLLIALRTARLAQLDDDEVRGVLAGNANRIAAGKPPLEPTAPKGIDTFQQPMTFARIHQYLSMATPLLWTRQQDRIGVLGLALNACDDRSNGHREELEQIRELLTTAQQMWLTLPEGGDERDRMAHTRATFRLIHLADIVAVTTPA